MMADNNNDRTFFSGSMARTALQLVIASILVGAIFSFLGLSAREFWNGIFESVRGIVQMIGDSVGEVLINLLTYLIVGAAVVVPIWIVARILSGRR